MAGTAKSWPIHWNAPDAAVELAFARLVTPYVLFLDPEIVRAVTADTAKRRKDWVAALQQLGIQPDLYLWKGSPCAFPGIKRASGKERGDIAGCRTANKISHAAIRVDDNHYPHRIWSWCFRERAPDKHGPAQFSLAHILDHAVYGNRCAQELILPGPASALPLYGLYTSVANTAFVPKALLRPTDGTGPLRTLLIRKVIALYGDCCALVPPWLHAQVASSPGADWAVEDFTWANPVGTSANVQLFLDDRARTMEVLLADAIG